MLQSRRRFTGAVFVAAAVVGLPALPLLLVPFNDGPSRCKRRGRPRPPSAASAQAIEPYCAATDGNKEVEEKVCLLR